ncbi:MAG: hypothetical protein U0835_12845 [Isosphaeraceae bacterium]
MKLTQYLADATASVPAPMMPSAPAYPAMPAGPMVPNTPTFMPPGMFQPEPERRPFESDHAFDGFVGPMTDAIQSKDPRSLTEARILNVNNWARPGTPVIGSGSYQVYALQLRLAVTERLCLYADKDGIVRFSPNPGKSVTGLANLMFGARYALIRDVENQFLFTVASHYEVPTGYGNIYQNQGSGLLAVYGIFGKEFGDNWHIIGQFGENIAVQNQQNSYFYSSVHLDKRFNKFVPLVEFNWFYYNSSAKFLPASVGIEGAGLINLGTAGFSGNSIVTSAVGFKYDFSKNLEFGVVYNFPLSDRKTLYGDQVIAELILRY